MPFEPPSDQHRDGVDPITSGGVKSIPAPERSKFGGTDRLSRRPSYDDDTPVSRSDLSKGHDELVEHREVHINWSVLLISSVVILSFSITTILMPDAARVAMKQITDWIATNLAGTTY